jgi:hypothetical protein
MKGVVDPQRLEEFFEQDAVTARRLERFLGTVRHGHGGPKRGLIGVGDRALARAVRTHHADLAVIA